MIRTTAEGESLDLEQLPPLPRGWEWQLPSGICTLVASGSTPTKDKMHAGAGEVPFIKVYNLTDSGLLDFSKKPTFIDRETHDGPLGRSRAFPGDVLINIVGPPLGKVSIVPDDFPEWNINQAIVVFRPRESVLNKYLVFAFLTDSIMRRVTSLAKATAGQHNIGVNMCRNLLPVPVAPLNEQRRIVAKIEELFSDLDAGVATLERAKANLKRYRSAVLKAAVEGKLTEQWRAEHPDTEPASALLARILTERRQKWESAQLAKFAAARREPPKNWPDKYVEPSPTDAGGLPRLPKDWCWASVDQLSIVVRGSSPRPAGDRRYFGGQIPWITVGSLTADDQPYLRSVDEGLTEAGKAASRWIEADTLLLTNSGATLGVPKITKLAGCINDGSVALLHVDYPSKLYLYYVLKSMTKQLRSINQGAAQPNLNTGIVKDIAVPLCSVAEQVQVVAALEQRFSQIDAAETVINDGLLRAARLRQSVLKQAFEGKLVPQDPKDEPASVLLERLRHPGSPNVLAKVRQSTNGRTPRRSRIELDT
jgi:type I restriction enzyme S subunit